MADAKPILSKAQAQAVSAFGVDVAVSAAAGSGKTSVLVHRFVRAVLEKGAAPDEILAVTFTDKAANVMKERLVREFSGKHEDKRRALETAYIGTIHSFCLRLLRENPIEAGVDPYFKVLSEGESDLIMGKVLDAVFEAQAERPEWLSILAERGEERVRKALRDLHAQARSTGGGSKLLELRDFSKERREAEKALLAYLEKGKEIASADKSGKTPGNLLAALKAAAEVPALLKPPLTLEKFLEVRRLLRIDKRGATMKDWASELPPFVERWQGPALQALYAPKKTEFLRVYRQFAETYEREKAARAVLDFDDLPILALKLLDGTTPAQKAVRERYREKFKHVFVDEFQDTNPLQSALIDRLRGKGNLFIVGDPRQSIYSFRHADPELFRKYEAAAPKRVPLAENFRSRAAVLDFANAYFAPGGFDPLVPAKDFKLKKGGGVEVIRVDFGEDLPVQDLEAARRREAELLAARIAGLVASGKRVEDGTAEGRPMRWGDAAILFRGTKAVPAYERALARAGVPFYSVSSRGFYERPEVKDFLHFLVLLDRPDDDIALAAALRSPLAGVSDDGLFWLARSVKKDRRDAIPLARALESKPADISAEDWRRATSFNDFLSGVRAEKNSLSVSAILERAAAWSGYEYVMLTRPGGAQAVANVRKLVEAARSLEEKAAFDPSEFVRTIRSLAERDDGAAEARVESDGGDAVLLMSIHAAKGLEFPCVAIANLGGKRATYGAGFAAASEAGGFGWSEADPDDEGESIGDAAHEAACATLEEKQRAEEDRIFYVGMTRAEERLILAGSRAKKGTWISSVSDFIESAEGKKLGAELLTEITPATAPTAAPVSGKGKDAPLDEILKRLASETKPYDLAIDLTVTAVMNASAPPKDFREPDAIDPETLDPEDEERSPRNEFGTLYHRLMEAGMTARPRGKVSPEFRESLLAPLTAAEKKEAAAAADVFWKSAWGKEAAKSMRVYPELPFIYKTKLGILKGQIDLIYLSPEGKWTILDYKTNRIGHGDVARTAAGYEIQLALYALVFQELFGETPAKGVLYFSSPGVAHEFAYTPEYLEKARETLLGTLQRLAESARQ